MHIYTWSAEVIVSFSDIEMSSRKCMGATLILHALLSRHFFHSSSTHVKIMRCAYARGEDDKCRAKLPFIVSVYRSREKYSVLKIYL